MRLSLSEIESIVHCADKAFMEGSKVYLFGSRVDDTQKGGDIDLFIEPVATDRLFERKMDFLERLQNKIGEQKVDVVIGKDENRLIEREAKEKGVLLNIESIKLEKYFNECDKHIQRIDEAYGDMQAFMPLTVQKYQNLVKDEVQDIDQYLFRFSKLQDTMGDKIFKLIMTQYEQSDQPIKYIDLLNKLEKYGFITSAKEWIYLRKIRNEISHQYDDEPEGMVQAINNIVTQKSVVEAIYTHLKERYNALK